MMMHYISVTNHPHNCCISVQYSINFFRLFTAYMLQRHHLLTKCKRLQKLNEVYHSGFSLATNYAFLRNFDNDSHF